MTIKQPRVYVRAAATALLFAGCLAGAAGHACAETLTVRAGEDLQAALHLAQPGDTIVLEAGATFTGNFVLPAKPGSTYITITSSAPPTNLPPPGTRTGPAYAPYMPKIKAVSIPAILAAPGSHHWRLENLEFLPNAGPSDRQAAIIQLGTSTQAIGDVPYEIVLDRLYVHGEPNIASRRGVELQSRSTTIANSYISDFKEDGADTQAIWGSNGPGPYLIENNYLEAAGENLMFGGADPRIPNLIPSDIIIRKNHFSKPLAWKEGHPAYAGVKWTVKNLLELKNAQRVLVDGNLFENCWPHAQNGDAIVLAALNQSGTAPWTTVRDITFTNNVFRHLSAAFLVSGFDPYQTAVMGRDLVISNNLAYDLGGPIWSGSGRFLTMGNFSPNVTVDHNTWDGIGEAAIVLWGTSAGSPRPMMNLRFTNNLFKHQLYGIFGDGVGVGNTGLAIYAPGGTFARNVMAGGSSRDYSSAPDNLFPSVSQFLSSFVDAASGNYRLLPSSPFKDAAADGTDIGVNMDRLLGSTTAGTLSAPKNVRILR